MKLTVEMTAEEYDNFKTTSKQLDISMKECSEIYEKLFKVYEGILNCVECNGENTQITVVNKEKLQALVDDAVEYVS